MTTKSSWEKLLADSDDDTDADDSVAADGTSSTMTVEDATAFDCGVCFLPLQPPIFQCIKGHAVCSPCRDKLMVTAGNNNNKRCHVCRVDLAGHGYTRCHAMERAVESVRVPCPNTAHGCTARVTYYDRSSHRRACPHARRRCSGHGCGFVGSVGALLDHVGSVHTNNNEAMRQFWTVELSRFMATLKLHMAASDVELVMSQAGVSVGKAAKALKESHGDIVTAIMELTN